MQISVGPALEDFGLSRINGIPGGARGRVGGGLGLPRAGRGGAGAIALPPDARRPIGIWPAAQQSFVSATLPLFHAQAVVQAQVRHLVVSETVCGGGCPAQGRAAESSTLSEVSHEVGVESRTKIERHGVGLRAQLGC